MKRILTGDNTTGNLHLGHLVGSIKNRVKYQEQYETFIILADTHALAYPKYLSSDISIGDFTYEVLIDNLSCGLDPEKVYFFNESSVTEIYEIFTIFSMLTTFSRNMRNPTIKQEIIEKSMQDTYSMGFLNFPILMASDILSVNADLVPVGEDQQPMIELARDIVERCNHVFGTEFKFPKEQIGEVARLVGLDGSVKMTKSLGNCIFLNDTSDVVKEKVMKMYTDPNRIRASDPGKVVGNPVFIYHDAFNSNIEEVNNLKNKYLEGKVGDVEVKEKLYLAIEEVLNPIRKRRQFYETLANGKKIQDREVLDKILKRGNEKVREEASKTLKYLKSKIKLLD
jgi:tryptophanyl-tRNA synthetase